jgi:hypothetical protein
MHLVLRDIGDCGDSWRLERPGLAHQHAFDFCAMGVYRSDGSAVVFASGLMSRLQRNGDRPADTSIQLRQVARWLRQAGFVLQDLYGFHGPASAMWGQALRVLERCGRSDLADRCRFRMRGEYVVTGWQAEWSPLGVLVARKEVLK